MEPRIQTLMEQVNTKRANLVEGAWSKYCSTLPEGTPDWEKGNLAVLLENQAKFFASQGVTISEDTTTGSVAGFEKFIFPMIRTVWPNLVSTELVSVQVMEGPVSMLFYMDYVAGTNKGSIKAGDALASARTGMKEGAYGYSSEKVELELLVASHASGGGGEVEYALSYSPVRPGSVTVSWTEVATPYTISDDGAGGFPTAGSMSGTSTINYSTGKIGLGYGAGVTFLNVSVTYDYNSEGSDKVPILDLELTSAPVASRADKIRARWSAEVAAMVRAVHGIDAEMELTEALAQQIRFSIDNTIINDLWRIAAAGSVSFDANPPANVSFYNHQLGLKRTLQSGANKVFKATRQGFANWIVAGVDAASFIESHPQFESSGMVNGPGVVFSGVFANTWKVFKNPFLTSTGFSSNDFLMGFKGNAMYNSGYIYAPWIPFFATPTVMLDDMVMRKAVMTHYAKKAVNGLYYCQGSILNA